MSAPSGNDEPVRDPQTGLFKPPKSYGGEVDEHHWSRGRSERNEEALEYYRERSQAPGVAEGGGARNFYCMECDGVIPHDRDDGACPHCGAQLEGKTRRYFNWVEIDRPVESDFAALARVGTPVLVVLVLVAACAWWFFG